MIYSFLKIIMICKKVLHFIRRCPKLPKFNGIFILMDVIYVNIFYHFLFHLSMVIFINSISNRVLTGFL